MATTRIQLSNTAYTDLGTTPCTVFLEGSNKSIYLVVTNSGLPAANTIGAVVAGSVGGADIGYSSQNAYAKTLKTDQNATFVIVVR